MEPCVVYPFVVVAENEQRAIMADGLIVPCRCVHTRATHQKSCTTLVEGHPEPPFVLLEILNPLCEGYLLSSILLQ